MKMKLKFDSELMPPEEAMKALSDSWEDPFGEQEEVQEKDRNKIPARKGEDRRISMPFLSDTISTVWNWSDLDYANSNDDPNFNLTVMALILATNIESLVGDNAWSLVENNLGELGFKNIVHYYFEEEEDVSCAAMVFAISKKLVHGKYVVAAVYRGTSSMADAISDIKSQADGFYEAGTESVNKLREYIDSQGLTRENTTLFITGHSYGAANASLVSILSTDLAERDSIFCYSFATPNYFRDGHTGEGMKMFSFDSIEDIVPDVPVGDDLDKTGVDIIYDRVDMQLNQPKQYQRFQRLYKYFRYNRNFEEDFDFVPKELTINSADGKIREDSEILRNHMVYTYMALILSELSDDVLDSYIGKAAGQRGVKKKEIKKKLSDKAAAEEIEVKKTVRKAARTAKEAVETAAQSDDAVAAQIEVKKTVRNAVRNVKEAVEPVVEVAQRMARRASLQIVIQSPMGGAITTDEIAEKIPEDAETVYVKVDENMLYWVRGGETGGVNIW